MRLKGQFCALMIDTLPWPTTQLTATVAEPNVGEVADPAEVLSRIITLPPLVQTRSVIPSPLLSVMNVFATAGVPVA